MEDSVRRKPSIFMHTESDYFQVSEFNEHSRREGIILY